MGVCGVVWVLGGGVAGRGAPRLVRTDVQVSGVARQQPVSNGCEAFRVCLLLEQRRVRRIHVNYDPWTRIRRGG